MCNEAVANYTHTLKFVLEYHKNQKMCDKAVTSYASTKRIIPECFMTQQNVQQKS